MDEKTREARSQAITLLLESAETRTEMDAIMRVGHRAGFLWTCPSCHADHYVRSESCCGKTRPEN